jgi:signal transduction histidine kinase
MIHSAAFKLTLWYLALIMLLSVSFSTILFRISSNELALSARRQDPLFSQLQRNGFLDFQDTRAQQISEGREHLRTNLIIFNLATLILGGLASYLLARRTLLPIEEAMEAQTRFTSDAAHELRTPLAVMETELEVALRDANLGKDEMRLTLESNLEEVIKLKLLSQQLLQLANQDSEALSFEQVNLNEIVIEASERMTPMANKKSITIVNKLPRNSLLIRGDATSLTEICMILLDNAIKYSDAKSKITATVQAVDGWATIKVADEGHGIRASDLPHIFDRFYRSDSSRSKKQVEGYGLGLSIASQLIKVLKGTISVTSEIGKGSVFTIKLPFDKSSALSKVSPLV